MTKILDIAVEAVQQADVSLVKYITANDTGATGAHQYGFHIHKDSWSLFFDKPGVKGQNADKFITIKWQNDFETSSRFIYYGQGTRNEYRLTRFGRGFPFLQDEYIGDLLIIARRSSDYYVAFILSADEDIEEFIARFNISSGDVNGVIKKQYEQTAEDQLLHCYNAYIASLSVQFPATIELARTSRVCYNTSFGITPKHVIDNVDGILLKWIESEYELFKALENNRYAGRINTPFVSVEELVETANTILNRRKSRAGKSLEHHLSEIFDIFQLRYNSQAVTEDNKRPDFLFPDVSAYMNHSFNPDKLVVLASKTTCKDRWRQILNEADRIRVKHLFTLQQGISKNQLEEMYRYGVCLVVPKPNLSSFPSDFRERILTLDGFVKFVRATQ